MGCRCSRAAITIQVPTCRAGGRLRQDLRRDGGITNRILNQESRLALIDRVDDPRGSSRSSASAPWVPRSSSATSRRPRCRAPAHAHAGAHRRCRAGHRARRRCSGGAVRRTGKMILQRERTTRTAVGLRCSRTRGAVARDLHDTVIQTPCSATGRLPPRRVPPRRRCGSTGGIVEYAVDDLDLTVRHIRHGDLRRRRATFGAGWNRRPHARARTRGDPTLGFRDHVFHAQPPSTAGPRRCRR